MPDIFHEFPISASQSRVFEAVTCPEGLNAWWTRSAAGAPAVGQVYVLDFGPGYVWHARVTACNAPAHIVWKFTDADPDWKDTRLRIDLREAGGRTIITLSHTGWRSVNTHYRVSSFCWAMYLRLLKRYAEQGIIVPYTGRLDA